MVQRIEGIIPIFILGYNSVRNGYKEMRGISSLCNYKRDYAKSILEIMSQYKYDSGYLLDSFINGIINGDHIQQLKKSNAYRIGRAITWLPSKIKGIMNPKHPLSF